MNTQDNENPVSELIFLTNFPERDKTVDESPVLCEFTRSV